jgi:hypothetical protein
MQFFSIIFVHVREISCSLFECDILNNGFELFYDKDMFYLPI